MIIIVIVILMNQYSIKKILIILLKEFVIHMMINMCILSVFGM